MSPISSSTLFHFTDRVQNLVDILTDEFRPHYSWEDFSLVAETLGPFGFAFPLISFCDIPLSQATRHMATYGNYALGLTKEWGVRNGVTPVLYSYPTSGAARSISALFALDIPTAGAEGSVSPGPVAHAQDQLVSHVGHLIGFLKPYEGPFLRRGRVIPSVRFYDEREWRYLPDEYGSLPVLDREDYLDFARLRDANENLRNLPRLAFEPSDIKYIVVASEVEILPMIREVERIKTKYTDDQVKVLTSRIVSAEQIISDF